MTVLPDGERGPNCADLGPDLSRRLAEIVRQEMRRLGLGEQDVAAEVALLVQHVAMRSAHAGAAQLAAELDKHGVEIHLGASLVDEAGQNLLVPPPVA